MTINIVGTDWQLTKEAPDAEKEVKQAEIKDVFDVGCFTAVPLPVITPYFGMGFNQAHSRHSSWCPPVPTPPPLFV